jgi:hypothetical protein
LAATGGTSLLAMGGAALAGGAAQSIINEAESYVSGERQLDPSNFENSVGDIAINTVKNSAINFVGDFYGKVEPFKTDIHWFQPTKLKSFFEKSYGQKIMLQTAMGAGINYLESMTEYYFCKYGKYATSMAIK